MSDFNSSLPVRTEQPGDIASKIVDALVPSQGMTVNPDGSINTVATATDFDIRNLTATQDNVAISDGTDVLAVNTDGSINAVVSATNLDIRDLSSASDSVEVLQASHDNLNVNANIQVGNADVDNANPVPVSDAGGSITVDAVNLDIRDLAFATDKVDVSGSTVTVDTITNPVTVQATNLDIRDLTHASDSVKVGDGTDFLAIETDGSVNVNVRDAAGAAFSNLNPLPVSISLDNGGDEINHFLENSAVVAAASATHSYTVTAGKTLILTQIEASASGKMRMQLEVETAASSGVFNIKFVQFNSTAEPNMSIKLAAPIKVPAGAIVKLTLQNRDLLPQSLYSTLSGQEV